jgi:single-strand DNA-binding protein
MLNTIALVGRLTREPELRTSGAGRPVCDLRLAVDGRGEEAACFVDVVCYDAGAEACQRYLTKGRLVAVDGRWSWMSGPPAKARSGRVTR